MGIAPAGADRQKLEPGIIGMSVHTDRVYLREVNRGSEPGGAVPRISSIRLVLRGTDFEQLSTALNEGLRDEAEGIVREAMGSVERAGADFLVVTANLVNAVMGELLRGSSLPVLDIARPVLAEAQSRGLTRLGLLSTLGTAGSGMYSERAADYGSSVIAPSPEIAHAVHEAIVYRLVRGIVSDDDVRTVLEAVSWYADQGAEAVILGCTDLTLLADRLHGSPLPLLDSTVLHARAARYVALTGDLDRFGIPRPVA
jgi:aspartate racemase